MGPPNGSIRRSIAPRSYFSLLSGTEKRREGVGGGGGRGEPPALSGSSEYEQSDRNR